MERITQLLGTNLTVIPGTNVIVRPVDVGEFNGFIGEIANAVSNIAGGIMGAATGSTQAQIDLQRQQAETERLKALNKGPNIPLIVGIISLAAIVGLGTIVYIKTRKK